MKKKVPGWALGSFAGALTALCVAAYTGALWAYARPIRCGTTRFFPCCSRCRRFRRVLLLSAWLPWCIALMSSKAGVLKKFHFCLPDYRDVVVARCAL